MFNIFKRAAKSNGIFTVSTPFVHRITGGAFVFTMNERGLDKMSKINPIFDPLAGFVPQLKQDIQQAKAAKSFFKSTGLAPIFMSPDTPKEELGEMLRHEMIHAAHMTNPDHVFFKQALQDAPSLSKVLNKEFGNAPIRLQTIIRKSYADQLRALKTDRTMNAKFVRDTERLAYSNMRDESFLLRAEEHGIKTHLSIAKYISHGEHTAPGRSKSLIQGLRDSGFACYMRKILSRFGSGWQGLDPELRVEHEQIGMRQYLATLKKGDATVGIMDYSIRPGGVLEQGAMTMFEEVRGRGHGKGFLTEVMKEGKSKGAITFRSDPAGLSEEMIHTFRSGERAGIMQTFEDEGKLAFKANLFHLERKIMDLGEGSAVVKAGTATIPSVLKATSRVMKSAL